MSRAAYQDWRQGRIDTTAMAQDLKHVLNLSAEQHSLLLSDTELQLDVSITTATDDGLQVALEAFLQSARRAGQEQLELVACLLPFEYAPSENESFFWGAVSNFEPQSSASHVVSFRACRHASITTSINPSANTSINLSGLYQPDVEYLYLKSGFASSVSNPPTPIQLQGTGMRYLSDASALELIRAVGFDTDDATQIPKQLYWISYRDRFVCWMGRRMPPVKSKRIRRRYELEGTGPVLAKGATASQGIVAGPVHLVTNPDQIIEGDIVVVDRLDPMWQHDIKRARGIIARKGGRTSHAALMAAELAIPAIVGVNVDLSDGDTVTLDCENISQGRVLSGAVDFRITEIDFDQPPELPLDLMLDISNPYRAFQQARTPNKGIGLIRQEFIVGHMIGVHPRAVLSPGRLDQTERTALMEKAADYDSLEEFFVDRLCQGIMTLTASVPEQPVFLRLSDFKSDEYQRLLGGQVFEQAESNPMLGLRGGSRYLKHDFKPCLELECLAIKRAREQMGLEQIHLVVPFVRTPEEGSTILNTLQEFGLGRSDQLEIHMMCEIPSNLILAKEFMPLFDGFSIGTSDLTQLILGVDRSSPMVSYLFDEGNAAVLRALRQTLTLWQEHKVPVNVCGRGLSMNFSLALWFAKQGVQRITVEPQRISDLWLLLYEQL
ncbi:MAG: putative PEP-binding protein [Gammaproteobacteria bacterium]